VVPISEPSAKPRRDLLLAKELDGPNAAIVAIADAGAGREDGKGRTKLPRVEGIDELDGEANACAWSSLSS